MNPIEAFDMFGGGATTMLSVLVFLAAGTLLVTVRWLLGRPHSLAGAAGRPFHGDT